MPAPSVLYLAGTGRSGSTVLANVIGEVAGFVSVGEMRYLWQRGVVENRLCGCGERFHDCPFWQQVLSVAFPDGSTRPEQAGATLTSSARVRNLPWLLANRRRPERIRRRLGGFADDLERLYAAVLTVSGGSVVVDSSKLPSYAVLLDSLRGLDVTVLHLVRDPRAAAFSWRRRKEQPDRLTRGFMERRGAAKSVALWTLWNGVTEVLWRHRRERYVRVAYEAFVADPRAVLSTILAAAARSGPRPVGAGASPAALADGPFVDDHTVMLSASHTVAGNPARLTNGPVVLRLDDEWRTAMSARDRVLVTIGAAPLLARYGYAVRHSNTLEQT